MLNFLPRYVLNIRRRIRQSVSFVLAPTSQIAIIVTDAVICWEFVFEGHISACHTTAERNHATILAVKLISRKRWQDFVNITFIQILFKQKTKSNVRNTNFNAIRVINTRNYFEKLWQSVTNPQHRWRTCIHFFQKKRCSYIRCSMLRSRSCLC